MAMASTALATTWPPRSATSRVAVGRLIGRLRVFGVFLHGRRNLLHRGGGFLQAGRLFLGALRQIGGAGRDLGRGVGDFGRRGLDLGNGRADPFRHRIGVVLELAEHALVVSFNSFGQIAIGKRAQHADEVLHCPGGVLAQRVHRAGEIEHEPALAIDRHALREIAGDHRFDQIVDLGLDRLLRRSRSSIPRPCRSVCRARQ